MLNVTPEVEELLDQVRQTALEFPDAEETFPWGTRTFSREIKGNNFLFIFPQPDHLELVFKLPRPPKDAALKLPFVEPHKSMERRNWLSARVRTPAELEKVLPMLKSSYKMAKPLRGPTDALPDEDLKILEFLETARQAAHKYGDVEEFFPYGSRAFRQRKGQIFLYASEGDDWLNLRVRLPFGEREFALTLPNVEIPKYIGPKGWVEVQVRDQADLDLTLPWIDLSFQENRPKRKAKSPK